MVLLEFFSGIGGFSMGLRAAGYSFDKVYFSEINRHAIANFKYNFPYAEHIGSVTDIAKVDIMRPDIITFGSPCQNFSAVGTGQDCGARQAPSSVTRSKLSGNSGLTFLSGRMLREYSSQDIARIFGASSKRLPTLAAIESDGNCLILHGFYPKAERGCTLSDVLQRNVPQRYFLSSRRVRSMVRANKTRFIPTVAEP